MSSNLKVNSLVPATGTEIGIGTTGGSIDFRCPATFGGNVTIGGTLTYDEVINIDSIGVITARSNIDCNGSLDVDGHTDLDNVSIAGFTTFAQSINVLGSMTGQSVVLNAGSPTIFLNDTDTNSDFSIQCNGGLLKFMDTTNSYALRLSINSSGNVAIAQDLDVDGHTNLDHVSIAGVTTFTNSYIDFKPGNGGNAHFRILSTGSGDAGIFFDAANGDISGSDYVFIGQKNNLDFVINPNANAGNIDFQRAGTTQIRIDSAGRLIVGGGTHAGGSQLVIKGGGTNTYSTLGMFSNHTNPAHDTLLSQIRFGSNATAVGADIRVYSVTDWASNDYPTRMSFYTTPDNSNSRQERLTIKSDGNVSIIDGNLQLASGHGIDFSATSAGVGTMTSELLDDYEEGIFTPTFKFGGGNTGMSLTSMAGIYTKIGRMVYVTVRYYMAGKGSSTGDLTLEGLPFAVGDVLGTTSVQGGWDLGWSSGMNSGIHEIKAYPWEGTSYLKFAKRENQDSAPVNMNQNDIVSAFDGRISFFYTT